MSQTFQLGICQEPKLKNGAREISMNSTSGKLDKRG
jgi:hypothetical protein